jgi:hypothetical protein
MQITKERYEEYLNQILNMYYQSKSFFVLFDLLNRKRKDSLRKLNLSPGFFKIVTMSLVDGIILSLSKILEKKRRSFSIYKFINISKANQQLLNRFPKKDFQRGIIERVDNNTFDEFIDELEKHVQLVNKLFDFRNEFTAHLDYNSLKRKKSITLPEDEIESLLNTLHKIICKISVAFNGSNCSKEKVGTRDLEILLNNIKIV